MHLVHYYFINCICSLDNWYQEFERWCPTMKVEKYHGSMDERRYLRTQWIRYGFGDIDVVLTT